MYSDEHVRVQAIFLNAADDKNMPKPAERAASDADGAPPSKRPAMMRAEQGLSRQSGSADGGAAGASNSAAGLKRNAERDDSQKGAKRDGGNTGDDDRDDSRVANDSGDSDASSGSSSEESESDDNDSDASDDSSEDTSSVENENQASSETASGAPASAAAGPPPPANTGAENVAIYVRDWGYRGGGRFLRHGPRETSADPALNLDQDQCVGFVCRYRRDPKQPLGPGNEGILVTLHDASLSKAQAALRRLGLPQDQDEIDVTVLHFNTPQVG